jgi:hypothetical protein
VIRALGYLCFWTRRYGGVRSSLKTVNVSNLVADQRLYWADAGTDKVETIKLDGSDRHQLLFVSSNHHFYGIALYKDALYFTDHGGAS